MLQDGAGHLWFGTNGGGVSRYNGQNFTTFTIQDGLGHNSVRSIFQDGDGYLWFGTQGSGVFTTFTTQDGLGHNDVRSIVQDGAGHLWFGADSGVVSRYDG